MIRKPLTIQCMKPFLILTICVSLAVPSSAQQTELDQLKEINARFIHNFVTNDVVSHDQIIHPSFICITSQGAWVNREEYLKAWASGFDPQVIVYWDYRNEKITLVGNTALVRSVNKYIIIKGGEEIAGMSQYTDTYVKEDGRWKCIQAQITPVSPANYPPDETIVKKYVKGKVM